MIIEIVDVEFEHKYAYIVYEVKNSDGSLVDKYRFQYCFEDRMLDEKEIRQVLKNCLRGYIGVSSFNKESMKNKLIGIKESGDVSETI